MLVGEEGRLCGSIGGGSLEYRAILKAQALLGKKKSLRQGYSLDSDGSGEVCGGSLELLYYYADKKDIEMAEKALSEISAGNGFNLLLPLDDEGKKAEISYGEDIPEGFFCQRLGGERVYVFGGGHIAVQLVPLLKKLGFYVVLTEDREEFADRKLFPEADEILFSDYSELEGKLDVKKEDYIVIMTKGHEGDFVCEKFALSTSAHYIGALGSRAKTNFVNRKLMETGIPKEEICRITAPIGLDIKSRTPAEIAVSIAAQLILIRNSK